MIRPTVLAVAVAAFLVVTASAAAAHPFTGGPASPPQIAVTALGGLTLVVGVILMLRNSPSKVDRPERAGARRAGLITVAVGLTAFVIGPDLIGPAVQPCVRPETAASVKIVAPQEGASVPASAVEITIELTGGKISSLASVQNKPGEGHLHLSVDGRLASMTGEVKRTLQLPPGAHVLEVEYVANDHAPFCQRVTARTSVTAT
ncbi:MAG: hypothetical protein ACT4OM_04060 [Actinomycetota bacterium]